MLDVIFIKGLTLEAIIGIYPRERDAKQPLTLDLELYVDTALAVGSGLIKDTVDYDLVADFIRHMVKETHFNLLESLVNNIADSILREFKVSKLRCTLYKPQAISDAETVGVTVVREFID